MTKAQQEAIKALIYDKQHEIKTIKEKIVEEEYKKYINSLDVREDSLTKAIKDTAKTLQDLIIRAEKSDYTIVSKPNLVDFEIWVGKLTRTDMIKVAEKRKDWPASLDGQKLFSELLFCSSTEIQKLLKKHKLI